ncbi:MAG: hypothetical protein ACM3UU_02940 [Ignavibacteriales bacterium]
MKVGEQLKRKKAEKGYIQEYFESQTGCVPSAQSRFEKQDLNLKISTLIMYGKVLGIKYAIFPDDPSPVRIIDNFKEIEIQNTGYDEELEAFIKDHDSEPFIRLAKLIKKYGYDSDAAKAFASVIEHNNKAKI